MSDQSSGSPKWRQYQEDVSTFFKSLGLDAATDVRLQGTRASHNIDVVVSGVFAGLPLLWIVECKLWNRRVPMEKVLAFRSVVAEVGADRGILVAESGYQPGSLESASSTNIAVTSLAELRMQTEPHLLERALADLLNRHDNLEARVHRLLFTQVMTKRSSVSRMLVGAGDVTGLLGHLSLVGVGLKDARRGNFPTVYGVVLRKGKEQYLKSVSLAEFVLDVDKQMLKLERLVGASEKRVRRGPDADLLEE